MLMHILALLVNAYFIACLYFSEGFVLFVNFHRRLFQDITAFLGDEFISAHVPKAAVIRCLNSFKPASAYPSHIYTFFTSTQRWKPWKMQVR
jgi:hypothetical protein